MRAKSKSAIYFSIIQIYLRMGIDYSHTQRETSLGQYSSFQRELKHGRSSKSGTGLPHTHTHTHPAQLRVVQRLRLADAFLCQNTRVGRVDKIFPAGSLRAAMLLDKTSDLRIRSSVTSARQISNLFKQYISGHRVAVVPSR